MANTFTSATVKKNQDSLILIFLLVAALTFLVIWQTYLKKEETKAAAANPPRAIKINLDSLKDQKISDLETFQAVPDLTNNPGRANPFLPY